MVNQIIPCLIEPVKLYHHLMTLIRGLLLTCISMTGSPPLLRPCLRFQRRLASRGISLAYLRLFSNQFEGGNSSYIPTAEWRRRSLKGEENCPGSLYPRQLGGPMVVNNKSLELQFGHLQPNATGERLVTVHGMLYTTSGFPPSSYSQEEWWPKGPLARI